MGFNRERSNTSVCFALPLLVFLALSCGGNGGHAAEPAGKEVPYNNPFFTPYMEIEDLIDASGETLKSSVSMDLDLGGGLGSAALVIRKDSEDGLKAVLKTGGKKHVLYPMDDNYGAYFLTVCAYDLDGDGAKELMVHDGDMFSLRIFQMNQSGPRYVGSLSCNWGFFVTDENLIVSLMGSQGGATIASYEKGNLDIIEEDTYIDKVMMSSKDYLNLRYQFDDNELKCHEIEKIYPADRYIICDQGSIYGDNCFSIDLDGDGSLEQLYMGRPGWGATEWDEMRVILPGTRTSFSLTGDIFDDNDPRAIERNGYDWHFSDLVQLSAKDLDRDGRLEIVASLGSREDHVDYVWSFDRKEGPMLMTQEVAK